MKKLLLALLPLLAGCDEITQPEIVTRPPVLFEIQFVNYAWGQTWKGFYVDATGVVYSFDRSKVEALKQDSLFTHEELMQKYDVERTKVRDVSKTELQDVSVLIPSAASAALRNGNTHCADAGILSFRAYIFDQASGKFRAVVIRQEGDFSRVNVSAAAQTIYNYLNNLQLVQHIEGCQP